MSRPLPDDFAEEAEKVIFRPAFFVFLDWPGGEVRAWTGYGDFSWDGETWKGVGELGSISPIVESSDGRANGLTLTLNGIPSDALAEAMSNDAQGRTAKVWLAPMLEDCTLACEPLLLKNAKIDTCPIRDDGETGSITVQIESELIDNRVNVRRRTHEDQQIVSPGDRYYEYTAGLQDKTISWGAKVVGGAGTPAGSVRTSGLFEGMGNAVNQHIE